MGLMSNQPLNRGRGLRNRSYVPIAVTVRAHSANDAWAQRNAVKVGFVARRRNDQYDTLFLSAAEVDGVAPVVWRSCSAEVQRKLVLMALSRMSEQELLRMLAADLKVRLKDQK